jgi:hypothetical protein
MLRLNFKFIDPIWNINLDNKKIEHFLDTSIESKVFLKPQFIIFYVLHYTKIVASGKWKALFSRSSLEK